jgi:hypothetical protein
VVGPDAVEAGVDPFSEEVGSNVGAGMAGDEHRVDNVGEWDVEERVAIGDEKRFGGPLGEGIPADRIPRAGPRVLVKGDVRKQVDCLGNFGFGMGDENVDVGGPMFVELVEFPVEERTTRDGDTTFLAVVAETGTGPPGEDNYSHRVP